VNNKLNRGEKTTKQNKNNETIIAVTMMAGTSDVKRQFENINELHTGNGKK